LPGFIGSNLAHGLVASGDEVRGIDNFCHGRRSNLAGIESKIDLREADITDERAIRSACVGMDYVLHQAALRLRSPVNRRIPSPAIMRM
jgi:nucleoside-diphosphate-sugar epimerase